MILALTLVTLIGLHNQPILVNPDEVTSVREPNDSGLKYLAPGTRCVITMTDGKFINLSEPCAVVTEKLKGAQ